MIEVKVITQILPIFLDSERDKFSKLKSAVDLISSTAPTSYPSFDEEKAQEFIAHLEENGFDIRLLEDCLGK